MRSFIKEIKTNWGFFGQRRLSRILLNLRWPKNTLDPLFKKAFLTPAGPNRPHQYGEGLHVWAQIASQRAQPDPISTVRSASEADLHTDRVCVGPLPGPEHGHCLDQGMTTGRRWPGSAAMSRPGPEHGHGQPWPTTSVEQPWPWPAMSMDSIDQLMASRPGPWPWQWPVRGLALAPQKT